jgi:hypothetical protein
VTAGNYGPGFRRMQRRAGLEGMEALRQDTLAAQARAKEDAAESRPVPERDRDYYRDYPPPRGGKKGKKT